MFLMLISSACYRESYFLNGLTLLGQIEEEELKICPLVIKAQLLSQAFSLERGGLPKTDLGQVLDMA